MFRNVPIITAVIIVFLTVTRTVNVNLVSFIRIARKVKRIVNVILVSVVEVTPVIITVTVVLVTFVKTLF